MLCVHLWKLTMLCALFFPLYCAEAGYGLDQGPEARTTNMDGRHERVENYSCKLCKTA